MPAGNRSSRVLGCDRSRSAAGSEDQPLRPRNLLHLRIHDPAALRRRRLCRGASSRAKGRSPLGKRRSKSARRATDSHPEPPTASGLSPTNSAGEDEAEAEFTTYPVESSPPSCPNDALRTGLSALLPDCRAYELVTPADTNARTPQGRRPPRHLLRHPQASPAGDKVSFQIEGGLIPGSEGTGSYGGDPYLATRGEGGWSTAYAGPNGAEAKLRLLRQHLPRPGLLLLERRGRRAAPRSDGQSPTTSATPTATRRWSAVAASATDPRGRGQADQRKRQPHRLRQPRLNVHPAVQLEPNAPPNGTQAIYDRTADEVTHVVSLLPGDVTPAAGENAAYIGASLDGKGIAFAIGKHALPALQQRRNLRSRRKRRPSPASPKAARASSTSKAATSSPSTPKAKKRSASPKPATSPRQRRRRRHRRLLRLTERPHRAEANPNGATPKRAKKTSTSPEEGAISFVGTVTERDVEGEPGERSDRRPRAVDATRSDFGEPSAKDPSRTTPDGSVLLFESRADLTGYDSEGHPEVYRYDSAGDELDCLSCNPTAGAGQRRREPAVDQHRNGSSPSPSAPTASSPTSAPTAAAPSSSRPKRWCRRHRRTAGRLRVGGQGVGSCNRPGGCVYLISSGQQRPHRLPLRGQRQRRRRLLPQLRPAAALRHRTTPPRSTTPGSAAASPNRQRNECQGEGCRPGADAAARPAGSRKRRPSRRHRLAAPSTAPRASARSRATARPAASRSTTHHRKAGSKKKGAGK